MPILVIGGTSESREVVQTLLEAGHRVCVTVTTATARRLYSEHPHLTVLVTRFDAEQLATFLQQQAIVGVIDASHPFAVEITRLALSVCRQQRLPYLRFQRSPLPLGTREIELPDLDALLTGEYLTDKRVLLTTGAKWLPRFAPWQQRATLFTRILPYPDSLQTAIAAGFSSERIIALRPPLSPALEEALWQHWQIQLVVTKASGSTGGETVKQQAAERLDIPLIRIARPSVRVSNQTDSLETVLHFCQSQFFSEDLLRIATGEADNRDLPVR